MVSVLGGGRLASKGCIISEETFRNPSTLDGKFVIKVQFTMHERKSAPADECGYKGFLLLNAEVGELRKSHRELLLKISLLQC